MKKIISLLTVTVLFFSFAATTTFAASAAWEQLPVEEAQPVSELQLAEEAAPIEAESIFYCPTVPDRMQPGSIVEYIDDVNLKIITGGFLSDDYTKDLSEPGMYLSNTFKGLIIDYCDDSYIGHFNYTDGIFYCPTIPEPMQAGSVVEYIEASHIKVIKGGFLSEYGYKNDLSEPGMYADPLKGLVVDYSDDGNVGHIKYPEGVEDPSMKPVKTQGFKAKAASKANAVTLTWNRNDSANGHKIYRSTAKNGDYKLIRKLNSANTLKYNDKGLGKGKTYYYKLVPYANVKGRIVDGPATSAVKARLGA